MVRIDGAVTASVGVTKDTVVAASVTANIGVQTVGTGCLGICVTRCTTAQAPVPRRLARRACPVGLVILVIAVTVKTGACTRTADTRSCRRRRIRSVVARIVRLVRRVTVRCKTNVNVGRNRRGRPTAVIYITRLVVAVTRVTRRTSITVVRGTCSRRTRVNNVSTTQYVVRINSVQTRIAVTSVTLRRHETV